MELNLVRVGIVFYFLFFITGKRSFLLSGALLNFLYFPFSFIDIHAPLLPGLRDLLLVSSLGFSLLAFAKKATMPLIRFIPLLISSLSIVLVRGGVHSPIDFMLERTLFTLSFGLSVSFFLFLGCISLGRLTGWFEISEDTGACGEYGLFFLGFSLIFGGISNLRVYGSPFLWDPRVLLTVGLFFFYATLLRLSEVEVRKKVVDYLYVLGLLVYVYALFGALYSPVSYRLI